MSLRIILIAFAMIACTHQEVLTLCNTEDPIQNLKWLKDFITEVKADPRYQSVTISAMEYQGQTIFNIYDIVQSCVYCDLRDCSGQRYMLKDYIHLRPAIKMSEGSGVRILNSAWIDPGVTPLFFWLLFHRQSLLTLPVLLPLFSLSI